MDIIKDRKYASKKEKLPFTVEFSTRGPEGQVSQDKEWCVVKFQRRIRFHDYAEIYKIPGLYEHLFYHNLQCVSPQVVGNLFKQELDKAGASPSSLKVLDIGAGNGMVGEKLASFGVSSIVGVDIIEEARIALRRDRPNIYKDYFILDLTDIPAPVRSNLETQKFNCLTSVAALGFADIPVKAFGNAFNLVEDGGWIVFNIKETFLDHRDDTGFAGFIHRIIDSGKMRVLLQERYRHRLATDGTPLHYVAVIARKLGPIPDSMMAE